MTHTLSNIIDLTNAPTPPRWFEFLLEPGRLQQHLETNGCDPSPTQLITLFFKNIPIIAESNVGQSPIQKNGSNGSPLNGNGNGIGNSSTSASASASSSVTNDDSKILNEASERLLVDYSDSLEVHIPPDSYEAKYRAKKAYALQTLAIKVASHLKWNLDTICNNLSIPVQYKLMQALTRACSPKDCPIEIKKFADIIFWHWFLRSAITYQLSNLQLQSSNTTMIYLSQLQQQQQAADTSALSSMGELFAPNSKLLKSCSNELNAYIWELTHNKDNSAKRMKGSGHPFKKAKLNRPLMNCFDLRDEQYNGWTECEPIEPKEFISGACYDLGRFFFFEENYELAKHSFEQIKDSSGKFPRLLEYLQSATDLLESKTNGLDKTKTKIKTATSPDEKEVTDPSEKVNVVNEQRIKTEKYLFDCMTQFSKSLKDSETAGQHIGKTDKFEKDTDLRYEPVDNSAWYLHGSPLVNQQLALEAAKGDVFMSQGNFKQAMGCFVGTLMLMTDYFRFFSKSYIDEEPYISRMVQCSISLSCFTQAVALCQMSRTLNYTIAFKQLNERVCNDCCDDIYECIWNVTLLEYIINLHAKRGEVERRTKVIQLIGQLELNENNPEDILKEAEHVRRGRFFRIMSNKYL